MKKILFLLAITLLAACSKGITFNPRFSQAEYEKMGKAVMGTYNGTYRVIIWTQDGKSSKQEIQGASISVSAWDKHQVVFHDFPISLLSKALAENSFVSQYLATRPNQDLTANYSFDGTQREANGTIYFYSKFTTPISFTADSEGEKHHLEFTPNNGSYYTAFRMEDCAGTMILRQNMNICVDITDLTDNGKSLAGPWPSFMRMQVMFHCE